MNQNFLYNDGLLPAHFWVMTEINGAALFRELGGFVELGHMWIIRKS